MRKPKQPGKHEDPPKSQKRRQTPPVIGNKRLAAQTRKILGKHYASKYRTQ